MQCPKHPVEVPWRVNARLTLLIGRRDCLRGVGFSLHFVLAGLLSLQIVDLNSDLASQARKEKHVREVVPSGDMNHCRKPAIHSSGESPSGVSEWMIIAGVSIRLVLCSAGKEDFQKRVIGGPKSDHRFSSLPQSQTHSHRSGRRLSWTQFIKTFRCSGADLEDHDNHGGYVMPFILGLQVLKRPNGSC